MYSTDILQLYKLPYGNLQIPALATVNSYAMYFKASDGGLYKKDELGNEFLIAGGGGGGNINTITNLGAGAGLFTTLNPAGNANFKSIIGTANQVTVTANANDLTFSLPQDIATTSSPTFNILKATGGFKDNDVVTAVKLGDAVNIALNTTNKTILGSINEVNYELLNELGNGVKSGFVITINADPTKIDIAPGKGIIVDNSNPLLPVITNVSYAGGTGIILTNIGTAAVSYLAINAAGTIVQQTSPFTMIQRRSHILLGAAIHSNRVIVNAINNLPDVALSTLCQYNDLLDGLKGFNVSGNVYGYNGANLNINKSDGYIFKKGANFINSLLNPHNINLPALVAPTNIRYRLQNGTEYVNTAVIDPGFYDLGGVRTALLPNKFTIQRINVFTSNLTRIQYGQAVYNSMSEAVQGIQTEVFNVEQNIAENGLLRGLLIVRSTATDLSIAADAKFLEVDRFGGIQNVASGGGTTTLQQAYNNSVQPQITTDATLGAVQIKRGSAADTDKVFEVLNGIGGSTASIKGNGTILSDVLTASRAVVSNASKELASSATTATELGYVNGVTSAIQTQLNKLYNGWTITKDPTGFTDPANVVINYDPTTQKITLTGTVVAYYQGTDISIANPTFTSGWVSSAHTNTTGNTYFLYYDGTNFLWATNSFPGFDKVLIAVVNYGATDKYAIRECHGFMPWSTHQNEHFTVGTWKSAGGTIPSASYTLNSTTATNRRPGIDSTTLNDEDLPTVNAALTSKLYTKYYLTSTGTGTYTVETAEIIPLLVNNPYYNLFSTPNWTQVLMPSNSVATVWVVAIPVTSSVESQKYRYIFVQPQWVTLAVGPSAGQIATAVAAEKLRLPSELNLGTLTIESPEILFIGRIIIDYTTNWRLQDVSLLTGSRYSQVGAPSGNFLSTVATDTTLTGAGTVASPLSAIGGSGLTIGSIPFSDGTKFTQDNANLFWDNTNKRLGIGEQTPLDLLHITKLANYGFTYLDDYSATTVHRNLLEFRKSHQNTKGFTQTIDGENFGSVRFSGVIGSAFSYTASLECAQYGAITGSYIPSVVRIYNSDGVSAPTPRLTILPNGYVGINEDSPAGPLHIAKLVGNNQTYLYTYSATTGNRSILDFLKSHQDTKGNTATIDTEALGSIRFLGNSGSTTGIGASIECSQVGAYGATNPPASLKFNTSDGSGAPGLRMTIDQAGNFGLGTTTLSNVKIRGYKLGTAGASEEYGSLIYLEQNTAAAVARYGLSGQMVCSHTTGTVSSAFGNFGFVQLTGNGGTTTNARVFTAKSNVSTGAIVTNTYGFFVTDGEGTGAEVNQYGVYVSNLTKGSTSKWAIYTAGTTNSYFGGSVGIGTTDLDGTPAIGRLTVKGSTNDGSTGIFVGRDSGEVNVFTVDTNGNVNLVTGANYKINGVNITNTGTATIDFGTSDSFITTTISDTNALTASKIVCYVVGESTAEHDADDYGVEGITAYATNINNGVGFDIVCYTNSGLNTFGTYKINYLIK